MTGMMRVIEIAQAGGPEVLRLAHRPTPQVGAGDILIRNVACGVNRPDALQRAGRYAPPPGASDLPGLESAGVVEACGSGVTQYQVGDQVCALLPGGGYAEYSLTRADHALPVPEGMEVTHAAGLCETFFTVWSNLIDRARLKGGESVLVHGGSSGIGTTAIQLAEFVGARVFATAGSDDKCAICESLGATKAINYRTGDFVAEIKEGTDGRGVDVILDMVGGEYLPRNLRCLAEDGRLVQIAFLAGSRVELDFMRIMTRRLTVTGSTLRPRSDAAKARIANGLKRDVWPLLASGRIAPVIDSSFALDDAAKAHERMESSLHIGKILLTV